MSRFPLADAIESVCRAVALDAQNHSHTLVQKYGDRSLSRGISGSSRSVSA